jgi:hypothetical protein
METRSMADPSVLLHPKFLVQLERGMVSFQNSLAPGSSTGLLCQVTARSACPANPALPAGSTGEQQLSSDRPWQSAQRYSC